MSAENQLQIKDLTPTTKGQFTLYFEVTEVIKRDEAKDTLTCRIVDQTGIINAYFDQYAKFIKQGSVYEIKNFKCKVFDHHLQLEMIKTTVISKKPMKICFRDMENDLSQKFYVAIKNKQTQKQQKNQKNEKKEQKEQKQEQKKDEKIEQKKRQKKDERISKKDKEDFNSQKIEENQERKKKATYTQKNKQVEKTQKKTQSSHKSNNNKFQRQQKKYVRYTQKQKQVNKNDKEFNSKDDKETNNSRYRKGSQKINNNQTRVTGRQRKWEQASKRQQTKVKYVQKIPQITINQMPDHQQSEATFHVFINLKKKINKQDYFLCKVSDQTGSTYFQFEPKMHEHLNDKSWHKLIGYKIFGDRDYGFIATQQSNSSYQLLEDYDRTPERKLLWR